MAFDLNPYLGLGQQMGAMGASQYDLYMMELRRQNQMLGMQNMVGASTAFGPNGQTAEDWQNEELLVLLTGE